MGIAKSSAHSLLSELTAAGLLERLPCGRYRLGWRTVGLAQTMLETTGYRERVVPVARRLAAGVGESVRTAVLDRDRLVYIASERATNGVPRPARTLAPELTPTGRVLLANAPQHDLGSAASAEGELIRRHGYAAGPQQTQAGVHCVAAPLRLTGARPDAAMAVCAPRARFVRHGAGYRRALLAAATRAVRI